MSPSLSADIFCPTFIYLWLYGMSYFRSSERQDQGFYRKSHKPFHITWKSFAGLPCSHAVVIQICISHWTANWCFQQTVCLPNSSACQLHLNCLQCGHLIYSSSQLLVTLHQVEQLLNVTFVVCWHFLPNIHLFVAIWYVVFPKQWETGPRFL